MYYGGCLYKKPYPVYHGGEFRMFNNVDLETIFILQLNEMARRIGLVRSVSFYSISEVNGVEKIAEDRAFSLMCVDALDDNRLVVVYALDEDEEQCFARNDSFTHGDPDDSDDEDDVHVVLEECECESSESECYCEIPNPKQLIRALAYAWVCKEAKD
ncbi:OLC1v1030935C1 [Oldenlandia corymbosa var. corymbosa]|uniref:OLC1v1030935C1 n=1 Tax=Oldenlandia corymbosa var. corymbosa TaxID=529605 RepID=A0AAV1CIA6_OLDCO|nr:OLC1v1030935C1 [Oldenlandia corymbosa var. corymbosa]